MKGQELKPCPFCGGAAEILNRSMVSRIKCLNNECGASVIGDPLPLERPDETGLQFSLAEFSLTAVGRWNRRQPENKAALIKVGGQFFDDGRWWNFMNEEHKSNTIAAGYLVRDLYVEPDGQ